MKKNTVCFIVLGVFLICNIHLRAQIRLNLFSYSDFFHAPNESYEKIRTFSSAINQFNFSSHAGVSIEFSFKNKFNIALGIQSVNRYSDCDCVGVIRQRDFEYILLSSNCLYRAQTKYDMIQIPLSLGYNFLSNQKIRHFIGIGNTIMYNRHIKSTVFKDSTYIEYERGLSLFSLFAPEVYYQLDYNFYKKVSVNAIIGVRKESFVQPNYAIFGKVGLGYQFGNYTYH